MIRTGSVMSIRRLQDKFTKALGQHNIPGLNWLVEGFNHYDTQRVKEIGPERAAAEWIVRCGGRIKFDSIDDVFQDYNALIRRTSELDPRKRTDDVILKEIYAIDASVSGFGCRHFEKLAGIEKVHVVRCKNFQDFGLEYMGNLAGDKIKELKIQSCPRITEFGLEHISKFKALRKLTLTDLPGVYGKDKVAADLKTSLNGVDLECNL